MKETILLDKLNFPQDLKDLELKDLELLAKEIRQRLLEIGDTTGGHLASNLGIVEITLSIHTLFDSPKDKITWDTSHQTYVHKMLTGRLNQMLTIRTDGGLSGFAKIAESPHDSFGAGHASTSLSAALGIAQARDLKKEKYSVISVFGDAALSGGMAFEALNNLEKLNPKSNFIGILNDNDMSISPPVGSMAQYMTKVRTSDFYNKTCSKLEQICSAIPKIGEPLARRIEKAVDHMRDIVLDTKFGVIFEEFGCRYLGPLNGHDLPTVLATLEYAKTYEGPILLHFITTKGKGHDPAEADPIKYHGVSPKKKETLSPQHTPRPTFSTCFGNKCMDLASKDKNIFVITPAMTGGSGLTKYAEAYPEQFVDVGIAEEHAVTHAAGMASVGAKPILAIYSTFLQRGYDQVIHDVALQNLPVIFGLDRAGLAGEDGPTHHGAFDYSYLTHIPNMTILSPKDGKELEQMMDWAITQNGPVSIRFPKGQIPEENNTIVSDIVTAKSELLISGNHSKTERIDLVILAAGTMCWPAYHAAKELNSNGHHTAVINLRFIKPLDIELLSTYVSQANAVLVIEEGSEIGGVSSYIQQQLKTDTPLSAWHQIALPDRFIDHGKIPSLHKALGFTKEGIIEKAISIIKQNTYSH